jgi:hypothetical protein
MLHREQCLVLTRQTCPSGGRQTQASVCRFRASLLWFDRRDHVPVSDTARVLFPRLSTPSLLKHPLHATDAYLADSWHLSRRLTSQNSIFSTFLRDTFSQPSSNSKKIQINTNWNWYENTSLKPSIFQVICHRLVLIFKKISDKHLRSNVWPRNGVCKPLGASNALSIHG